MSEAEKIRISVLDMALADADDAEVNASDFRRAADEFESAQPEIAKRYREAAHRQAESAAWLRGERQGAGVEDLGTAEEMEVKTAPTTGLRAVGRIIHHLAQRQAKSEGLGYTLTVWPGSPRRGDIVYADVVDALRELLHPTPPMTIERACEVLNEHEAGGARWAADQGWVESRLSLASGAPVSTYWPESLVLAVADQILRDAATFPAKEVG